MEQRRKREGKEAQGTGSVSPMAWSGAFVLLVLIIIAGCAGNGAGSQVVAVQDVSYPSGSFSVPGLLCQPAHADNRTMAVVLTGGDGVNLAMLRPVCEAFASKGLVALAHENVNGSIGDNVQAVADAVAWLHKRNESMGVALWAHSSGTIFSVFAAYERPDVKAFVDTSGHMQIPLCDKRLDASPNCAAYLEEFPAPIFVVHGQDDQVVNVSFAQNFAGRLQELGKPYKLLIVPGAGHEFMIDKPGVLDAETAFILNRSS